MSASKLLRVFVNSKKTPVVAPFLGATSSKTSLLAPMRLSVPSGAFRRTYATPPDTDASANAAGEQSQSQQEPIDVEVKSRGENKQMQTDRRGQSRRREMATTRQRDQLFPSLFGDVDSFFNRGLSPFDTRGLLADPLSEFNRVSNYLMRNMDRAFQDIAPLGEQAMAKYNWRPKADLYRTKDGYAIEAELAGIPRENIQLEVDNNMLVLRGEKKYESAPESKEGEAEQKEYTHKETFHGTFVRSFELPEEADLSQVKASYKDGILKVTIPRRADANKDVHKIQIEEGQ